MKTGVRFLVRIIGAVLGFLGGLFGCGGRSALYMGPPPQVIGKAIDGETGKPVPGLRIQLLEKDRHILSRYTAADGSFLFPASLLTGNRIVTIRILDIDGEKNGRYAGLSNTVSGKALPGPHRMKPLGK